MSVHVHFFFIHLSPFFLIHLFIHPEVHLYIHLSFITHCLHPAFNNPFICLSVHPSEPFICSSIYSCFGPSANSTMCPVHLSMHPFIFFFNLSIFNSFLHLLFFSIVHASIHIIHHDSFVSPSINLLFYFEHGRENKLNL